MCGIVFIRRFDKKASASKMVIKRYKAQKARGSEGFGFIALADGKMTEYVRTETEADILKHLEAVETPDVIFHHRYPTSTPNFSQAAHPIKVSHASLKHDYYVIHNGVIWNDKALKAKHEKLGFVYTTEIVQQYQSEGKTIFEDRVFNDSEALAIELALDIDGDGIGVDVSGSIAFVALQTEKGSSKATKIFFGRNDGSPLKLEKVNGSFMSLTSAGSGQYVPIDKLFSVDYHTNKITSRDYIVGDDTSYYHGTYGYATEKPLNGTYGGSQGLMGFRSVNDYDDDTMPYRPRGAKHISDNLDDEMEYYQLKGDYDETQKRLATLEDQDGDEAQYLQEHLLDLEDELQVFISKGY